MTLSGSAEYIDGSVSFGHTFAHSPAVVCSLSDTARGATSGPPKTSISVTGIALTGFTYRIKTDGVAPGGIVVYWVAVEML